LRAAQVGVPLSDLVTESGETSASAGVGDAQAELDRPLVYEQASSSDLAFAEATCTPARPTTIAHRPTWRE